ncbi:hypothetical protein [Flavobacterium soyangense]|uniref:Uncharacterized protein n=1 Tax=Flavobacterium soyangense TaxID=2023265 RepID=A0A930UET6_9FLAO|nr:hypothetical protein [Flavobacterium soyangense]MBF2709454.1 hypothetical protein [Flavobacterium soyangense]
MRNLKLKEVAENTESIREFLETKPKMKIVKNILSDAIIFSRLSGKMSDILNLFNPNNPEQDFNLESKYYGISNAGDILKVKDQELDEALTKIYCDLVYVSDKKDCEVNDLAQLVLFQWLKTIKKYNSSYNSSLI